MAHIRASWSCAGASGRGLVFDLPESMLQRLRTTAGSGRSAILDGVKRSIDTVSQVPDLRVMSRVSVFRYMHKETDPQQVGRELKVDAVLFTVCQNPPCIR